MLPLLMHSYSRHSNAGPTTFISMFFNCSVCVINDTNNNEFIHQRQNSKQTVCSIQYINKKTSNSSQLNQRIRGLSALESNAKTIIIMMSTILYSHM